MAQEGDPKAAIDASVIKWRQGDCFISPFWFIVKFNPERPNTEAAEGERESGNDLVGVEVPGVVVVSQTCDVVRSCSEKPVVCVSPLKAVSEELLEEVRKLRRPDYAYLPGVADKMLVADLSRLMTVEKGVVAVWARTSGCPTEGDQKEFRDALGRKLSRFPFPDDFNELVDGLREWMKKKHNKDSPDGAALQALREIRVLATPSWGDARVDLTFHFIRDDKVSIPKGSTWPDMLDKWMKLIPENEGRFRRTGFVTTLGDLTGADYYYSDRLDLDQLSKSK